MERGFRKLSIGRFNQKDLGKLVSKINSNLEMLSYLSFLSLEDKQKLISSFEDDSKIAAVFLFGSVVRNEIRRDSDLDFAILLAEGELISGMQILEKSTEIESITGFQSDIGIISKDNLIYAKEAILSGIRIFDRNKVFTDSKVNLLLSMYYLFKEEMKEVYNAYRIR